MTDDYRGRIGRITNRPMSSAPDADGGTGPRQEAGTGAGSEDHDAWVYVPAHPLTRDGQDLAEYEFRELPDGRRVLPAFTTVNLLVRQLGKNQPWLRLPIRAVVDLAGDDHVAVDPVVDPAAERWDEARLRGLIARQRSGRAKGYE